MTDTSPNAETSLRALIDIMAALRHPETGCAWDLKQTHASIAPYTIEEAMKLLRRLNKAAAKPSAMNWVIFSCRSSFRPASVRKR